MRSWILKKLIAVSVRHRVFVLVSSILVSAGALVAASTLTLDPRWSALLPKELPAVKEYNRIDEHFLQPGNMIVAIQGKDPLMLEQISDEVSAALEAGLVADEQMSEEEMIVSRRYARHVYGKLPESWLVKHALALVKPKDAKRMRDIYKDVRLTKFIAAINNDLESEYSDSESLKTDERQVVQSLDSYEKLFRLLGQASYDVVDENRLNRVIRDITIGNPYQLSLDNKMALVLVAPAFSTDNTNAVVDMDYRIEELLQALVEKYPDYKIERTGLNAIARDEMDSVGPYTAAISLGALVVIFLLLAYNFRSFLTPIFALIPIITGILWSMGFIALTLGQLNLITAMMMVVLLGLGIDFTIHLSSRFYGEMTKGKSIEDSLFATLAGTGKGVVTGALTTAIAFFVLCISDTVAIREFGICAGSGVIITLFASIWILPSLLAARSSLVKKRGKSVKPIRTLESIGAYSKKMFQLKMPVVIIFLLFTIAGVWGAYNLQWEWNFLNLEAKGLRSVELQDEIVERYKLSVTPTMLTVASVEESRAYSKLFKDKRVVGEVSDISQWTSREDFHEALPYIQDLHLHMKNADLANDYTSNASVESLADEIDRFWANIVEIQALAITGGQDRIVEKTRRLVARRDSRKEGMLRKVADRYLDETINKQTLTLFANAFSHKLNAKMLSMSASSSPVTVEMVPFDIHAQYASKTDNSYLINIMPSKNLYEKKDLKEFEDIVTKINASVTGVPQLVLTMNESTLRDGKVSMLIALGVIFLLVLLDFRKGLVAAITTLPLVISLACTCGLMFLLGHKLNYMNMIAIPVIIGIGVDDGVHFFHHYLDAGAGNIREAATQVGRAMMLTTLTTMIGFGSLMFYVMRGMASLGFVLFFGVGFCFVVTVTLLPALSGILEKYFFLKKQKASRRVR